MSFCWQTLDSWLPVCDKHWLVCGLILVTTTLACCTYISIHDYSYYCMFQMHICYNFYYGICKNIVTNKQEVWIFITWLYPLIIIVPIVQVTMYENFCVWRVLCSYVLHEKWVQPLLCNSSGNFLGLMCVFMTLVVLVDLWWCVIALVNVSKMQIHCDKWLLMVECFYFDCR